MFVGSFSLDWPVCDLGELGEVLSGVILYVLDEFSGVSCLSPGLLVVFVVFGGLVGLFSSCSFWVGEVLVCGLFSVFSFLFE